MKDVLDCVEESLEMVERLSPFGSMIKIAFWLKGAQDVWIIPNWRKSQGGYVKIVGMFDVFRNFNRNKKQGPMCIKNVFEKNRFF